METPFSLPLSPMLSPYPPTLGGPERPRMRVSLEGHSTWPHTCRAASLGGWFEEGSSTETNVQRWLLGEAGLPHPGSADWGGSNQDPPLLCSSEGPGPSAISGELCQPPMGWASVAFLPGEAARKHIATAAGTSFLQQDGMVCPMNCPGIPLKGGPSPEAVLMRLSCPSLTPPPPPLPPRRPRGPAVTPAPLARCVPAPGPLGWPQCAASALLRLWLTAAGERREHPTGLAGQQPLITSPAWFLGENETSLSPTEGRFPWKGSEIF